MQDDHTSWVKIKNPKCSQIIGEADWQRRGILSRSG